MVRLIAALMIGLKAWMLYDAYKRRAENYWLWIIVGVPGGSLLYLVLVRLKDRDAKILTQRVLGVLEKPRDVEDLRSAYEDSPSFAHRMALAQGLFDAGEVKQSREHFNELLHQRKDDADGLFGFGLCELELGEQESGIKALRKLIELSPGYRDYAAYPELAEALYQGGKADECLELLRGLAKSQPRLPHVVLLAQYLRKERQNREARDRLRVALGQHDRAPKYVRRQYRRWAQVGRQLLVEVS